MPNDEKQALLYLVAIKTALILWIVLSVKHWGHHH